MFIKSQYLYWFCIFTLVSMTHICYGETNKTISSVRISKLIQFNFKYRLIEVESWKHTKYFIKLITIFYCYLSIDHCGKFVLMNLLVSNCSVLSAFTFIRRCFTLCFLSILSKWGYTPHFSFFKDFISIFIDEHFPIAPSLSYNYSMIFA